MVPQDGVAVRREAVVGRRAAVLCRPRSGADTVQGIAPILSEECIRGETGPGRRRVVGAFDPLYVARRTAESRACQGLARHVEDPGTISRLRVLLSVTLPTNKEGSRSRVA